MFDSASLHDLDAFGIGHATCAQTGTGCTVFVAPQGAVCGVDVRGAAPATRETDLLKPENMIEKIHAIVLSGGSAFGLEASCGVAETLAAKHIGFSCAGLHVPIVVGASLFDLLLGSYDIPDKALGKTAAEAAFAHLTDTHKDKLLQGNVGAATGASVGKWKNFTQAMKTGFGWKCIRAGNIVVAAFVALNAWGCVRDKNGTWIAGLRDANNHISDPLRLVPTALGTSTPPPSLCCNTTLGVILTNVQLTKAQATKTASCTHDAYARAIKPVHSQQDGDTIFCFASAHIEASQDIVAILACEAMQDAIEQAVYTATSAYGLPAARDL